jgi:L-alanine-DL-glutamate epimerase-like enolase superfamily enzyme
MTPDAAPPERTAPPGAGVLQARLVPVGRRVSLRNGAARWNERRGVLLEVRDADGRIGRGEASPLPGYSPDTAVLAAGALDRALCAGPPLTLLAQDADDATLERWLQSARDRVEASVPSARLAIETALLDLVGQRLGLPVAQLLGAPSGATLEVSTLIDADGPAEVQRAAERQLQLGYRSFKLKLGADPDHELPRARALRHVIGPDARLRFDANRCWSPEVARLMLARLAPLRPEVVEEPVLTAALPALFPSPLPLGLDESLPELLGHDGPAGFPRLAPLLGPQAVTTLVLKPALLGGLLDTRALALQAVSAGCQVIVTHLWDGPVALAAAASLALALPAALPAGVAAHRGLAAYPGLSAPWLAGPLIRSPASGGLGLVPVEDGDGEVAP